MAYTRHHRDGESMKTAFLRRIKRTIDDCVRLSSSDTLQKETLEIIIVRMEGVQRHLNTAGDMLSESERNELLHVAENLVSDFRQLGESFETEAQSVGYRPLKASNGGAVGRKKLKITETQLEFLVSINMTRPQMAKCLHVSDSTVKRRLRDLGINLKDRFSNITDSALDDAVKAAMGGNSHIGPNAVRARLLSQGVVVQRLRIREAMLRVDPAGVAVRGANGPIIRRTYTVAGPNSLWHFDGNHRLIRWGIVIHGCIDGYSRVITHLQARDNNRSDTVLALFKEGTTEYGLPSRVRCDYGGENNGVCEFMEARRGHGRGSALRGKSVHNQRIERLWVDVWKGVTNLYHDLFHFMEANANLDIEDDVQMWCLRYVYLPKINAALKLFHDQWNNHGLRTEGHMSPLHLFVTQAMAMYGSDRTAVRDLFDPAVEQHVAIDFGADGVEVADAEQEATPVQTTQPVFALDAELLSGLETIVQQAEDTDDFRITTYLDVLEFAKRHIDRA